MSDLERADDLASAWLRAWSGDADFGDCCAPDIQYEDPLAHDPLRGLDALARHAERLRETLPDLRIERTGRTLTDVPYACIPWRAAGTHKNGTISLPATNRFVALPSAC